MINNNSDEIQIQTQSINQLPHEVRRELYDLYQTAMQHNPHGWYLMWDENRIINVDEARKSLLCATANGLLKPAIKAMVSASGLSQDQAKTCVYYAVTTFLCDDYPELMPILLFQGNSGTGKSQAMNQLEKLVALPRRVAGRTYSEIGRNIDHVVTAIFDEGDFKQDRIETELLQLRCCKNFENQTIHIPPDQRPKNIINFGATLIARREPFTDTATRNRTITIKTQRRLGTYHLVDIGNQEMSNMAGIIRRFRRPIDTTDRVNDAWRPLTEIATTIGDAEWLRYQFDELRKAQLMLSVGDQYEPEDVLIKAIMTSCQGAFNSAIKLNRIKQVLEGLDVKWTTQKIHAMAVSLGFSVRFYQGYDHLVANNELLVALATDRNIRWEEDNQER